MERLCGPRQAYRLPVRADFETFSPGGEITPIRPTIRPVTRHKPVHAWIEVEAAPFAGGPKLPAKRRDGSAWPSWVREMWKAWASMPHARLWRASDWQFALDTTEVAASAFRGSGAKVGLLTELRYRDKVMGTTWSARQDMRIRYVDAGVEPPSTAVTNIDKYRNL